jgi:hypothetical protein
MQASKRELNEIELSDQLQDRPRHGFKFEYKSWSTRPLSVTSLRQIHLLSPNFIHFHACM